MRPDQWMNVHETKTFLAESEKIISVYRSGLIKYVRLDGDTFFFADASTSFSPNHKTAVTSENLVSAAYIKISDGKVSVEGCSLTLKIGPAKDDEKLIARKLGLTV